jgi:hypothetical protein
MKRKKYFQLFFCSLSFVIVMIGCEKDNNDPPPVVNQPPEISGLDDLTLTPGFETHEIDFANYVTDQEGEIITYQVVNSDESVITISLEGSVLTITEVGPGTSDITVTATDGQEDHEVTETFTVTVEAIVGAADYTGTAAVMLDFNGFGEGHVFDNPIPGVTVEGWDYDWETPDPNVTLANNDHIVFTVDVAETWIWFDYNIGANNDFTGKKLRFDISYFTAPTLTNTHWDDDEDPNAVDVRIFFVDEDWESGGAYYFSSLDLEYSSEWQEVEIPLSDFVSFWDYVVDPTKVAVFGMDIYGGTESDPLSFRIDNFGIVD